MDLTADAAQSTVAGADTSMDGVSPVDTPSDHRRLRACIVCLPAGPLAGLTAAAAFGGTEVRAWTLAKGLAAVGVDVTFLVRGDRPARSVVNGVTVRVLPEPMYARYVFVGRHVERTARFPLIRVRRWSPTLLWRLPIVAAHRLLCGPPGAIGVAAAVKKCGADVVLPFGVQSTARLVIDACNAAGIPTALAIGCDDDLDMRYRDDPAFVNPYGDSAATCLAALTGATAVLVQTPSQAKALRERFGRKGVVLPNPVDGRLWNPTLTPAPPPGVESGYVLWVGRAEPVHKRPALCLEIAARCPGRRFLMVLNPADTQTEADIQVRAGENVTIIPGIPPEQMPGVFAAAGCLLNTSAVEGFPNTYLQAAAVGVPIASLVVLPEWLTQFGAGQCFGGDLDAAAKWIEALPPEARTTGRDPLLATHEVSSVSRRLAAILRQITARFPDGP